MKVVFLIAFFLATSHCRPVREFHSGIPYHHVLNWKYLQSLYELLNICRKPPMSRQTTPVPMIPFPPITPLNPNPYTPDRRGDS